MADFRAELLSKMVIYGLLLGGIHLVKHYWLWQGEPAEDLRQVGEDPKFHQNPSKSLEDKDQQKVDITPPVLLVDNWRNHLPKGGTSSSVKANFHHKNASQNFELKFAKGLKIVECGEGEKEGEESCENAMKIGSEIGGETAIGEEFIDGKTTFGSGPRLSQPIPHF